MSSSIPDPPVSRPTSRRSRVLIFPILGVVGALTRGILLMGGVASGHALRATSPIKHVVVIIKENHSFDNMFGRFPGAAGTIFAMEGKKKVKMPLTPDPLPGYVSHGKKQPGDINHDAFASRYDMHNGKMNFFYKAKGAQQGGIDVADSQYSESQIPDYWRYAASYGLADHFFSYVVGDSFPNHLAIMSGNSYGVISNPWDAGVGSNIAWGCDQPKSYVQIWKKGHVAKGPACFSASNLADEANKSNVTWKYYASPKGTVGYI